MKMYHLERICALLLIFTVINQACALAFHSFGEIYISQTIDTCILQMNIDYWNNSQISG